MPSVPPIRLKPDRPLDLPHRDSRDLFALDRDYANFRPMITGGFESSTFFRSAGILNNPHGRSAYVAQCAKESGVTALIDLTGKIHEYEDWRVFSCDCGRNSKDKEFFGDEFAAVLRAYIERPLIPVLICCESGKYRTGFAAIILEALSKTPIYEIEHDFMRSFANNNTSALQPASDQYKELRMQTFDPIINQLREATGAIGLYDCAEVYLRMCGLNDSEIEKLRWLLRA